MPYMEPIASTEPVIPKDGGQWTVATAQPAEGSSKCEECGFLAKNETGLKTHMTVKHKGK